MIDVKKKKGKESRDKSVFYIFYITWIVANARQRRAAHSEGCHSRPCIRGKHQKMTLRRAGSKSDTERMESYANTLETDLRRGRKKREEQEEKEGEEEEEKQEQKEK